MPPEHLLPVAFLVSFVIHAAILAPSASFTVFNQARQNNRQKLEVRYVKSVRQYKGAGQRATDNLDPFLKLPLKITARETSLTPAINREAVFKPAGQAAIPKVSFTKPAFIRPDSAAAKTKITLSSGLSQQQLEKSGGPAYISHSQIVREKIKRSLYQNYNRTETGEVYLSFVLSRDGFLKDVRLSQEKSTASEYLKAIALQSIRDASPFPDFPKGLDYNELSFNVVISFEME